MTKYIAIVEDDEALLGAVMRGLALKKDIILIAKNYEEWEKNLLPRVNEITVWFLDIELPEKPGDRPSDTNGIKIALYLHDNYPNIPRICTSSKFKYAADQIKSLYTDHLNMKSDIVMKIRKDY